MIIKSTQDMLNFGEKFAKFITGQPVTFQELPQETLKIWKKQQNSSQTKFTKNPKQAIVIELIGDVGVGKTTFTQGLAKGLGIKEPITSPSFTISKSYSLPRQGNLIHYDFYRLSDPGLMANDLIENLKNPDNIVIIEWGETITDLLPKNHVTISINYHQDNSRIIKL